MVIAFRTSIRRLLTAGAAAKAAGGSALSALWTFPAVLGSAVVIAWGAEAAQFLVSQGMALAILAWLQTLPEFAVEAVIAWEAGRDPEKVRLATANLTGSLRLLVGLGWPMIYATAAIFHRRAGRGPLREIALEEGHSVEVIGLLPCIAYFSYVALKGSLTLWDSLWLTGLYVAYLWVLNRLPPEDEEGMEDIAAVPRFVLRQPRRLRNALIVGLFAAGGAILYVSAHPFLESMLAMAVAIGMSQFVFVQWVAPFLSEFPEKVSAFNWARRQKAPMALMNMISSNINQWTMLAAMIPITFRLSQLFSTERPGHRLSFDEFQTAEIALTIAQSFLGFVLLANMRFAWHEALLLFALFLAQFTIPEIRAEVALVYVLWSVVLLLSVLMRRRTLECISAIHRVLDRVASQVEASP